MSRNTFAIFRKLLSQEEKVFLIVSNFSGPGRELAKHGCTKRNNHNGISRKAK